MAIEYEAEDRVPLFRWPPWRDWLLWATAFFTYGGIAAAARNYEPISKWPEWDGETQLAYAIDVGIAVFLPIAIGVGLALARRRRATGESWRLRTGLAFAGPPIVLVVAGMVLVVATGGAATPDPCAEADALEARLVAELQAIPPARDGDRRGERAVYAEQFPIIEEMAILANQHPDCFSVADRASLERMYRQYQRYFD